MSLTATVKDAVKAAMRAKEKERPRTSSDHRRI